MTLLEKILLGIIVGSFVSLVFCALLGRYLHDVDEEAKRSIDEYRKEKR